MITVCYIDFRCFKIDYSHIYERSPTNEAEMYLVDAGIAFNSPYPPVLRKERDVDLILSFDFSARNSNDTDVVFGVCSQYLTNRIRV